LWGGGSGVALSEILGVIWTLGQMDMQTVKKENEHSVQTKVVGC